MSFELIHDVLTHGAELDVSSAWTPVECVVSADQFNTPDGRALGDRVVYTGNAPTLEQEVSVSGTLADLPVEFGAWVKTVANVASEGAFLTVFDPSTAQVSSIALTLTESFNLHRLQHVFSDNLTDTSFFVQIGGATSASGDTMDVARAHCAIGSGNLTILPETDYERRDRKIEDEHRGRTGRRYVYKWGEFFQVRFGVEFISSLDQAVINSWWSSNAKLLWVVDTGFEVESVQIVGDQLPIGEYATPGLTEYSGLLEITTY